MKKFLHVCSILLCLTAVLSFKSADTKSIIGVYTVAANDPSQIVLKLNNDFTFTYQDFSNPAQKVTVSGRWEAHDGKVLLKDYVSTYKIHDKWRITADGKFAKSVSGLTIYSLMKQEGC